MKKNLLFAWIGMADLKGPREDEKDGPGPIAQAVDKLPFDEIHLLNNVVEIGARVFAAWLRGRTSAEVIVHEAKLTGPTRFGEIYEAATEIISEVTDKRRRECRLTCHLSPGTPAMAAVWIIIAKTRFPAELIESSRDHGVRTAAVPFDISADFLPDLLCEPDEKLEMLSAAPPPEMPGFENIIHRSLVMKRLIMRARRVAPRSVPVLLEGESGTGKELMARAIHRSSPRRDAPFVAVNCGSIPSELVESTLFGHEKGAFTGAHEKRDGCFRTAGGGTLFLDEIGELPLPAQVKMLRTVQEKEIVPVGSSRPIKIDVRIIAATNRVLIDEIAAGRFRSDLFYRLAVAVLTIPPIRDRPGDLGLLVDTLFEHVNEESADDPGYTRKRLSAAARNVLLQHNWPGNVRELMNTLRRAAIWSEGDTISATDAREALLPAGGERGEEILNRPLGGALDLPSLITKVASHYLVRALRETNGNKTRAADLIGLPSYQTFTNWMKRHNVYRDQCRDPGIP